MYSAVERILAGEFNQDTHSLDFSCPRIELEVRPGEKREGSFFIYGPEMLVTEGTVTSNRLRMQCLTGTFSGSKEEIAYCFDAADMEEGESLKGEFRIVSNRGEYSIVFEVSVVREGVDSSLGQIKNLFHFTNLAKSNWEEAVNLFYSHDFAQIFKGADKQYYTMYKGLSAQKGNLQNVEEFLLEIKKKQKVEYILEEAEIRIDSPKPGTEYKVVMNRNGWGFSELNVEAEGDFLVVEKFIIRDEDFLGNCYRLPFYLAESKLHAGKNFGKIRFYNAYTSMEVTVIVHKPSARLRVPGIHTRKKHLIMEMMQYYEAFRTKQIPAAKWMKETGEVLEELERLDERDPDIKLFKVQLLITQERFNEATWLLNQAEVLLDDAFTPERFSYYLYLTTLLNRDDAYIDEVADRVQRIYTQNSDNWRVAWLLLYLAEDYGRSPSRRWMILEEQFMSGCNSPVLYIEGLHLLTANPSLLMRLSGFELQVLLYAAKRQLLTADLAEQIVYLSFKEKNFVKQIFVLLEMCYEKYPNEETLGAICTLLIKGNLTGSEYFKWYASGVSKELRITRLYEYYMMSKDLTKEEEIPKIVLMYFAFDSSLDSTRNAYLYAYVHRNREEYPELYASYREQIERFTVFQILKGRNNKWLSYLYKNIITPGMITEETAEKLAEILFVHRITLKRNDICKVLLVYEKQEGEEAFAVTGKEVYVPVYGSDVKIYLEDLRGNRYGRDEDYQIERLMVPDKLAVMVAPYVKGHYGFDIWFCERGRSLAVINEENEEAMVRIAEHSPLLNSLKKEIRMRLVHYYYDNDKIQELDTFLERLLPEQIENADYAEVVRYMVIRGMYEKAYEWISIRGGHGIEAKIIMRLCSRLIDMDAAEVSPVMTALMYQAFQAGKYDENLLNYLVKHYEGTIKEMRDIWKAAKAFGVEIYDISRRILVQMLYTGAYIGEKAEVFRDYVKGGANAQLEHAFLAQCCFDYFVSDKVTDEYIMQDLQRVIDRQEEIPFVCKLAYTKYYAENKKFIDEKISRYLMAYLRELLLQDMYFPYFKEYADHIGFMRQFSDKTMISYKTEPGNKAVIHYILEADGQSMGEYITEEMRDMFYGVCVKQFILFFGEKLQYYISETGKGNDHLTESGTLSRSDTDREQKESKYTLINDIAIGRVLHDDQTMNKLLYEYFEREHMAKELFEII